MLPAEFNKAVDGFNKLQDIELRRTAWLAVAIINGSGNRKEPITIDDLLPPKPAAGTKVETAGESHARLLKRFEGVKL